MEELLRALLTEVRGLRGDLKKQETDFCDPEEALTLLGLNNPRYLTFFVNQNLLNRSRGGRSFVYYKTECRALAEKLKNKTIIAPPVRELFKYK